MTETDLILPDFEQGPIDRLTLALYAGASGDHTLIHLDADAAKSVGLPDVIGHGMLSMAIMGRALKHWFGLRETKSLAVRFSAPVFLGDMIRCSGTLAGEKREGDSVEYALDLIGYANDRKILAGTATVRVPA